MIILYFNIYTQTKWQKAIYLSVIFHKYSTKTFKNIFYIHINIYILKYNQIIATKNDKIKNINLKSQKKINLSVF